MYAFLEECPLGYEDDAIMLEAYSINAERALLAERTFTQLETIRLRKQGLRSTKYDSFNDMMSFYEDEEEKDKASNEKKQGLASKAWDAIKKFFSGIKEFFQKMGKPKDGGPQTINLPEGTAEGIGIVAKFANAVKSVANAGVITAMTLLPAAGFLRDVKEKCIAKWEDKTGKTTKKHQRDEAINLLNQCDQAIDVLNTVIQHAENVDAKTTAEELKEGIDEAKTKIGDQVKQLSTQSIWGWIKAGLQKVGDWIKSVRTTIFDKLGIKKKEEEPAEDSDEEDEGEEKDDSSGNNEPKQVPANTNGNNGANGQSGGGTKGSTDGAENNDSSGGAETQSKDATDQTPKPKTHKSVGERLDNTVAKGKELVNKVGNAVTGKNKKKKKNNSSEDESSETKTETTEEEYDDIDFDLDAFMEEDNVDPVDDFNLDEFLEELDSDDGVDTTLEETGDGSGDDYYNDPITEEEASWEEELGAILDSIS